MVGIIIILYIVMAVVILLLAVLAYASLTPSAVVTISEDQKIERSTNMPSSKTLFTEENEVLITIDTSNRSN